MLSRREFLFGAAGFLAAACSEGEKESVPTISAENNNSIYTLHNAFSVLSPDIGIQNLIVNVDPQMNLVFVYSEFSPGVSAMLVDPSGHINPTLTKSFGILPFDRSFDINKALNGLNSKGSAPEVPWEILSQKVSRMSSNKAGLLSYAPTPPIGSENMFVFGPRYTYSQRGNILTPNPPAILKAKFVVTEPRKTA